MGVKVVVPQMVPVGATTAEIPPSSEFGVVHTVENGNSILLGEFKSTVLILVF